MPIEKTKAWVDRAVIGLNLCPFAKAPQIKGLVRYTASQASNHKALLDDLKRELLYLVATSANACETTLLIHPNALTDFLDYNDFLGIADALLVELNLDGVLQIASFHPDYQFAGTSMDDIGNYTNRSPYPMLHLIRESSLDQALQGADDPDVVADTIVARNQETLAKLGRTGWERLWM